MDNVDNLSFNKSWSNFDAARNFFIGFNLTCLNAETSTTAKPLNAHILYNMLKMKSSFIFKKIKLFTAFHHIIIAKVPQAFPLDL